MTSTQGQQNPLNAEFNSEKKPKEVDETEASPLTAKSKAEDDIDIEVPDSQRRGRLSYDLLLERIRQTKRSRLLYATTACLCAILLVIIIFLVAFWPQVPFFLRAEVCVDKECVVASQQLLLWSNSSQNPCADTLGWACGNFQREYDEGNFYALDRGEWDATASYEYEELRELNVFISMLPSGVVSYSVESLISGLYKSCREIETLDKSESDVLLRKAINSVGGWRAFRDGNRLPYWDFKKALLHLQTINGIFPFFKISIDNRYSKPFEYIIVVDGGELGLPHKHFYNIDNNNEIVNAYKMLLRDFAINMGIVVHEAELFADSIFHYEKRIVNRIVPSEGAEEAELNQIKTIEEIRKLAPSLPIFESIKAIFPAIKITEEREILVKNVGVLQAMSIIVSTSDKQPLNDFIIWSLARNLIPYLSREYRVLHEKFQQAVYGQTESNPRWLSCTKTVRNWLSFGVDALQQNPSLVKTSHPNSYMSLYPNKPSHTYPNKTFGNDELLQLMFYNIRNQVMESLEHAKWIHTSLKEYIVERLTRMRFQIGIPEEVLDTKAYINEHYSNFLLQNLFFVEHLQSKWTFRKTQMAAMLNPLNILETIISEMYAKDNFEPITYSATLNMILISKRLYISNYYDYKFPISINFARVGSDIAKVFLHTIEKYVAQYYEERNQTYQLGVVFPLQSSCISQELNNMNLPEEVLSNIHITLSGAKIAAKALSSFVTSVDNREPIVGASINPRLTYETLGLSDRRRLPGLRSLGENELFTLAYLQTHCNAPISDKDYGAIKPYVDGEIAESQLFNIVWKQITFLPLSLSCSTRGHKCTNIL